MDSNRMQAGTPLSYTRCAARTAALALLLLLGAACSNGGGGGGGGSSSTPTVVTESAMENESAATAQVLGSVGVGTSLTVEGEISGYGADQFDNYRIEAGTDVEIAVELGPRAGASGDLDLWVADERGAVRQVLDSDANEADSFTLDSGEIATLVVTGFDDLPYELILTGSPAP